MYGYVFTLGIALIRVNGSNSTVSANSLTDYSYINARDGNITGVQIARCVTGLGPNSTDDNSALGGVYFNESRIPFARCSDNSSAIVQPRPVTNIAGVINITQCSTFAVAVEGIYTCEMLNSSMMNQAVRFGVYFTGRSKLLA